MEKRKKVLAIVGSTRRQSSNLNLLKAIQQLTVDTIEMLLFTDIERLPHFNPDNEDDDAVKIFKQQLNDADGVIICTPEYAHGVPGTLKNAIDWTVGSNQFSNKPTALITASTDGRFAHNALLETLLVLEAKNVSQLNLLIQFIKTKVNANNQIIDEPTLINIKQLLHNFMATMNEE